MIPRSLEQTKGLANRFDAIDYVFWFGDFNFRLAETRANVENTISELSSVHVEDNGEHLQKLLAWDQLARHKFTSIVHDFQVCGKAMRFKSVPRFDHFSPTFRNTPSPSSPPTNSTSTLTTTTAAANSVHPPTPIGFCSAPMGPGIPSRVAVTSLLMM